MVRTYNLSTDGEKNVSAHFKVKEFINSQWTQTGKIEDDLVEILESLRSLIMKPIKITPNGGYRTTEQNKNSGGADNSYHLKGMAADIQVEGMSPTKVAIYAAMVGARGVGVYDSFTHIDSRETRYVFRPEK